jgi:hypothetical protein
MVCAQFCEGVWHMSYPECLPPPTSTHDMFMFMAKHVQAHTYIAVVAPSTCCKLLQLVYEVVLLLFGSTAGTGSFHGLHAT